MVFGLLACGASQVTIKVPETGHFGDFFLPKTNTARYHIQ